MEFNSRAELRRASMLVDRRTASVSEAGINSKPRGPWRNRRWGRTALTAVAAATAFLLLAISAQAATITVTTTADDITPNDGSVSLREAIQAINEGKTGDPDISSQNPGVFGVNDTINFNISAAKTRQVIDVGNTGIGALPALTNPVTINGFSEQGATQNTLANGDNANLLIALEGASAGANADGLLVGPTAEGSTIEGIDIFNFSLNQVELQGRSTIAGNDLGFDTSGSPTHSPLGLRISNSSFSVVGGTTPAARNVLSGNVGPGLEIVGSTGSFAFGNLVEGNFIGTDTSGRFANGNGRFGPNANIGALVIAGGILNTIGGSATGARNVISGNGNGLDIRNGGEDNVVQGNFIGVAADGVTPLPNAGFGVHIGSSDNLSPPAGPGQPNEPAASANIIGLNPKMSFNGLGNVIAFNGGDGVQVDGSILPNNATPQQNDGNSILGNSIFSNGGLGIDLKAGLTANKPNNLQAAPTITAVTPGTSSALVQGTLHLPSSPKTALRIELFSSRSCDASGFGEGQTLIGATTAMTDGAGAASFSANTANVSPGQSVTATATNTSADPSTPAGSVNIFNTSEFSRCFAVPAPPAAGPPPPPAPSNAFTVISKTVKQGVITLKVQTHAPGALNARATFTRAVKVSSGHGRHRHRHTVRVTILYGQASKATKGVTPAVLTTGPTGQAGGLLKRLHTLRLSIKVSFTPTGGTTNTIVFPLTVSSSKPKPKNHHR
jgi:CSLREA domain-containing protein